MNPTTFYTVNVIGKLWSGQIGSYTRNFTAPPQDIGQVKMGCGDFDSIEDYQMLEISFEHKTEGNKFITINTKEIIKDWWNQENEFIFLDNQQ